MSLITKEVVINFFIKDRLYIRTIEVEREATDQLEDFAKAARQQCMIKYGAAPLESVTMPDELGHIVNVPRVGW